MSSQGTISTGKGSPRLRIAPVNASHTLAVPSRHPPSTYLPSFEMATELTSCEDSSNRMISVPDATSQSLTVLSSLPVTINLASAEKAATSTRSRWPSNRRTMAPDSTSHNLASSSVAMSTCDPSGEKATDTTGPAVLKLFLGEPSVSLQMFTPCSQPRATSLQSGDNASDRAPSLGRCCNSVPVSASHRRMPSSLADRTKRLSTDIATRSISFECPTCATRRAPGLTSPGSSNRVG